MTDLAVALGILGIACSISVLGLCHGVFAAGAREELPSNRVSQLQDWLRPQGVLTSHMVVILVGDAIITCIDTGCSSSLRPSV